MLPRLHPSEIVKLEVIMMHCIIYTSEGDIELEMELKGEILTLYSRSIIALKEDQLGYG